jgi:hypothetical protein
MDLDLIKLADLMEGISREIKRVYGESPTTTVITAPQEQSDAQSQPEPTEETETEKQSQPESKFADLEDAGTSVPTTESNTPTAPTTETTTTPSIPPVSSGSAVPSVTQDTQNAEQRIQKLQEELRAARLEAANQGTFNFQPLHL